MPAVRRGHLPDSTLAPARGERVEEVLGLHGVVIEQILSGELETPVEYDEDHDEWVILLDGGAELDVGDERCVLGPGDWVFLPWHTAHRLVSTNPGSRWLAVSFPGEEPSETPPPVRRSPNR